MPVAAEVHRSDGYDHKMAEPRRNVLVAAWAQVGLEGLVGLDAAHLDGLFRWERRSSSGCHRQPARAQATIATHATIAATTIA